MKSNYKLLSVIGIIVLSITSIYPLNLNKDKKTEPNKRNNSFWVNHQYNWNNTKDFNSSLDSDLEEIIFFNDRTVNISNKKVSTSKDDSFEDNKGNNKPSSEESGNIRWKGFRFQNLNIPANAIINNVELTLYGYKQGNTTVNVKDENLKSPTSYSDDKNYLSSTSTTSKSIDWFIPSLSNGLELKSPNLKDVVQEVVNSKDGITHLSLIISSSKKWEAWNFDDRNSSYYPKVNISYTIGTPNVSNDSHTMDENTVASINVFANDDNVPTNGSIIITSNPKNGIAIITDSNNTPNNLSDDKITYTPNPNFDGTDTFAYKVCDSSNNCDSASVSVTINDGDNNSSVFENEVFSPEDVKITPITDFNSNNNTQCIVGNIFKFSNLSNTAVNTQPTAAINYAWNFGEGTTSSLMNPSISYAEAGTYDVKLTATNVYGTSEKTIQIVVEAIIRADIIENNSTIDEDAGTVKKEFTLNNNSDFTNFTWILDGFDASSFNIQKTISFEFTEEGEHTLILNTIKKGCDNTVEIPITITSDEISTGNDGGLESESLGDAISIRYLQRKMNSVPTIFEKTKETIYNKKKMVKSLARKSKELPINRNVTIKGYSQYNYLAVYKSLLPGTIAADYSAYNYLSFTAKGNGPTQLVLVKSRIENWSEQFRAAVNLTDEEQTFFVPFESFT